MLRHFTYRDAKSDKFWEIRYGDGKKIELRWGRTGTEGQRKTKSLASAKEATREADKLIAAKLKKGYVESGAKKGGKESTNSGEHAAKWRALAGAKDPRKALRKHFAFLADSPGFDRVLDEIMHRVTRVRIAKKNLIVTFGEEDEELFAGAPDTKGLSAYPLSAQKAAAVHGKMGCEDGLIMGARGILDFGIYDKSDDVYALFDGKGDNVRQALWDCVQNDTHWVYHPTRKNSAGELALFPIQHELENEIEPVDARLGSVFLSKLVELQQWDIVVPDLDARAEAAHLPAWWEGVVWAQSNRGTLYHRDKGPLDGPFPEATLQKISKMLVKNLASFAKMPLDEMPKLSKLTVAEPDGKGVRLVSLDGIERARNLESLDIDGQKLTDIEPLRGLATLQQLSVRYNKIKDLAPIERNTNLAYLYVSDNPIKDIGVIKKLTKLKCLWLAGTAVRKLDLVAELPALESLEVPTRMSKEEIAAFKKKRPDVEVSF